MKLSIILGLSIFLWACAVQTQADESAFTALLPPPVVVGPLVSRSQKISIEKWDNFSLSVNRANLGGNLTRKFSPEISGYYSSIYWTPAGIAFFCLGIIFYLSFGLFLFGRFFLGYCGGRKEKKRKVTRIYKHTPTAVFAIAGVTFLVGSIMQLAATHMTRNQVGASADSLDSNGRLFEYTMRRNVVNITLINMQIKNLTNITDYLDTNPQGQNTAINESVALKESTRLFASELRARNNINISFAWIFFVSGMIAIAGGAFCYWKKMSIPVLILGVYAFSMVGTGWIICSKYHQQQIYHGDICTQVENTMNNSISPQYGEGYSLYINCFSPDTRIVIGTLKHNYLNGLLNLLDMWRDKANKTTGANVTEVNAVKSLNNVTDLLAKDPYQSNTWLNDFSKNVLYPTYWSLANTIDLNTNQCRFMRQWAQTTQEEMCPYQYDNWIGMAGMITTTIAFLLFAYALVAWKNVFDRLKETLLTHSTRSDLDQI